MCAPELNLQNDDKHGKKQYIYSTMKKKIGSTHFCRATEWTKTEQNKKNEIISEEKRATTLPNDARSK